MKVNVLTGLWAKGLNANEIHSEMHPVYGYKCFFLGGGDEENAMWAEIRIRYRGVISRSSVAWTAANIVL